ncbi:MAG: 30S ribosomal protein S12 methylthiotransferase RimO, partial [Bacteroidota bacterium]
PLSSEDKEERKAILMNIQKDISEEKNRMLEGRIMKVIIDRTEGDYYVGRTERDAPEVDGEVLVNVGNETITVGMFYNIEIYDSNEYDLFGKIVSN